MKITLTIVIKKTSIVMKITMLEIFIIKILVVINTAGFSILPTTMMTIRQNYHSQNILAFYPYSLFIGFSITIIGIVIIKVIEHV